MTASQSFSIRPLSAVAGAEVVGLDGNQPLSEADLARIRQAWRDHCVLVFRDQHFTPAAQEQFSARFGPLKGHILAQYLLPGHPFTLVLSNKKLNGEPVGLEDAGRYWHSDVSYDDIPPDGSLLYALEIPPTGGDTLFANQYAAHEMLPPALKVRIANLRARHVFNYTKLQSQEGSERKPLTEEQQKQLTGAAHPVVRTHPESGRKALYVNPGFTVAIEGMAATESEALLKELFTYATHDAVIYRHVWKPHDAVLWDNRCLMHHATTYDTRHTRHMHRTTISGTKPR
ncbi:MAG: TauD/TfdA family dioxygenase [Rhodospirillaceae bacterium]|nr:TauD/TfdA family dioxygenase [Rhodospirillaceae bacterium]